MPSGSPLISSFVRWRTGEECLRLEIGMDATAFAFGACKCSNPVALVLLRRLFLFFQRYTSSSVGIVLRGCLTNPHSVPFLLGKKRSTRSSYPLLSWRSIEMQVVLASQLAYPMILFVFFLAGSGRPPLLNYLLLVSCMACTQDGGHDLLSSWLFFSSSFFDICTLSATILLFLIIFLKGFPPNIHLNR